VKALAVLAAVLFSTTVGVGQLRELTQNRPDTLVQGTETVIELDVATRDYPRTETAAVQALWAVCAATIPGDVTGPVASAGDDGPWTVTISPAIGENGRKRLLGCLEDSTLDRVIGHVESISSS
jgi:hypothetical protein